MLSIFKNLFKSTTVDLAQLIKDGAVIVDVRSKSEFASGHVKGSINIPLEQVGANVDKLKKNLLKKNVGRTVQIP